MSNMALLLRTMARQGVCLSRPHHGVFYRQAAPMGTTAKEEMNKFWSKNAKLSRPMSPHITIYKWSVPAFLFVTKLQVSHMFLLGMCCISCFPLKGNAQHLDIHTVPPPPLPPPLITCLCLAISAFAVAALVLPESYPHYLDLIHSLSVGPYLLGLAKLALIFPASFHTYNGIRHLCWDLGKGFRIPEVYRSGYTVIGLSIVTSIAVAFFL
ncbi:succinate dehydrogenase cytochrome b560 subunit, mitochondrial [Pungitius pungitius]|uniref:succinate dehydrogenase cytochrome b560 subunit, mitochondrial n=1 Tax=Pungitius pungitius TaxID=134920 RepID=UPI002E0EADB3